MVKIEDYEKRFGAWTADCIEYAPGRLTHPQKDPQWLKNRAETYAYWFENYLRKPLAQCSILDIGALEGGHTYHFARLGAQATGVEIRDDNLGRCSFLKEAFPELSIRFVKDDMHNISVETYGRFDGILLAGTLYHVDAPAIIPLLKKLRAMTSILIVDAHTSTKCLEKYEYSSPEGAITLYGRSVREHCRDDSLDVRDKRYWSSYSNDYSFWMTENSLANALRFSGFDSVCKPLAPTIPWYWKDRGVWIAAASLSSLRPAIPFLPDPDPRVTEHEQLNATVHQPSNPSTVKI